MSNFWQSSIKQSYKISKNPFMGLTLEYLFAEQDGIREQDGILSQKVKQVGWNKRAGWNFVAKS